MGKQKPILKKRPAESPYGSPAQPAPAAGGDIDLFDIMGIARRQIAFIIFFMFLGVGLAYYQFLKTPNVYSSNSTLYVTSRNPGAVMGGLRVGTSLVQDNLTTNVLTTQSVMMKGDTVMLETWKALSADPEKKKCVPSIAFDKGPIVGSNQIKAMLKVKSGSEGDKDLKNANVITATCYSADSLEAQVILSTAIEQFEKSMKARHAESASVVTEAINQARKELENVIAASNEDLTNFVKNSKVSFLGDEKNNPLLTQLQEMSTKRVEIDYQVLLYTNRLKVVEEKIGGRELTEIPDAEIVAILSAGGDDDYFVQTISTLARGGAQEDMKTGMMISAAMNIDLSKTTEILMEMAKLKEQNIGPDNPKMIFLQRSLEELENVKKEKIGFEDGVTTQNKVGFFTYAELLKTYIIVLQDRITALRQQQEQMNAYISGKDPEIRAITEYCQTLESKKFSVDSQREMYYTLGRKLDDMTLIQSYGGYQLEVIVPPLVNSRPVSPIFLKYLLFGAALGLFSGCGLAYLIDFTDTTFRTPQDIGSSLNVPVLAQFPIFAQAKLTRAERKNPTPGVPISSLISYHSPNAPQCEVFRALRTKLFYNPTGVNYQVVQCTSPHPGDGKTMFLCNMAIKLANAGKRTLLIDGDIRKPDVHRWFNLEKGEGFSDVLSGTAEVGAVTQTTAVDGLYIISAGSQRKSPSELLSSERFDELLALLRTQYDVILIDSPPILYVSDPCVIAPKVDGVLYSLRVRRRGRPDAIQGVKMLSDVGATLIGCVINCFEKHRYYNEFATQRSKGGGYGSNYGSGYGAGYGASYGGGYGYGYGYGYGKKYGYGYGNTEEPKRKKEA